MVRMKKRGGISFPKGSQVLTEKKIRKGGRTETRIYEVAVPRREQRKYVIQVRTNRGIEDRQVSKKEYDKWAKEGEDIKRFVMGAAEKQAGWQQVLDQKGARQRELHNTTLDNYGMTMSNPGQRTLDYYSKKKKKRRKEKSLEQRKTEEAEELIDAIARAREEPGAERIREPWREKSVPYKIKKKLKEAFPVPAGKIGRIEAYHKTEEMAAKAYEEAKKAKEELKKKKAKRMALVNIGTGNSPEMVKLVFFLIGAIIVLSLIAWLASMF